MRRKVRKGNWVNCCLSSRQDKYHEANEVMYREYGPVVREEVLWNFPLVHLFDRRDIERVLRYPSAYPLRPPNEADVFYRRYRKEYYPNDGVVSLNGPDWHKLRMQLTPPLTREVAQFSSISFIILIYGA